MKIQWVSVSMTRSTRRWRAGLAKARDTIHGAGLRDTEETIFDKIVAGDIPSEKVYEDDLCLAFKDVAPCAPVHAPHP